MTGFLSSVQRADGVVPLEVAVGELVGVADGAGVEALLSERDGVGELALLLLPVPPQLTTEMAIHDDRASNTIFLCISLFPFILDELR
jgi:hypothetical protein